jgi:dolichyl-phosphate beta-glucosyltransferase
MAEADRMTAIRCANEVVVPLYNERQMIPAVHAAMVAFGERHPDWTVRFVDDGSRDDTAGLLGTLLAVNDLGGRLVLEALPRNVGKADAVAHGVKRSGADCVYYMDGDLAYDPELLVELQRALQTADVAIGSRGIAEGERPPGILRRVMGEAYNLLVRVVLGLRHRDTQAGIKGFRAEAARQLFARRTSTGFGFDAELLFIARRRGMTVAEIPVRVNASHDAAGSNVRLIRDPLRMLGSLLRIRLDAIRGAYRQ